MKYIYILFFSLIVLMPGCNNTESTSDKTDSHPPKKYTRFNGNYNTTFNDLQDRHAEAASKKGVGPLNGRSDTSQYMSQLIRIPGELEIYKVDRLKHSVPYLVSDASLLLTDICINFRDSLISKGMPLYKPIVTSITRTDDDVKSLSKRNRNASENSVHRYATTFDISWTRFQKANPMDDRTLDDGKLKAVLGQVLHDLRQRDRCYIKHERKQACFHITVR